jgi:MtrB/PioB family decaheme-associated outer membrane protein
MKRAILLLALLALAAPGFAQETKDFDTGEITLGAQQTDSSSLSSKFQEYRDFPEGFVLPSFRLFGQKGKLRWDLRGKDARQDDERYSGLVENDGFRITADFNRIPHRFGNAGTTLLTGTAPGVFELSDTLQRSFQGSIESVPRSAVTYNFLNNLVTPSLKTGNVVDLALQRQRSRIDLQLWRGQPLDVHVIYTHERRTGDRSVAGTSFGFGNVVELPEPVHYLTQDVAVTGSYDRSWGSLRGAVRYNWFENSIPTLQFDNPFRATDSTDASAYQAPGPASVNGPSRGLIALPPNNDATTGSFGATVKLARATRISGDVSWSVWHQDETPFIPYTTNTAIPSLALPATALDGKVDVKQQALQVTSRPTPNLSLSARFRVYDFDNQTPRISLPSYVHFDAALEAIPRISVPYGYRNDRLDLTGAYDLGTVTVDGGYRHTRMDRTFRDTEQTTENAVLGGINLRAADRLVVRAGYEFASRGFDHYDTAESEDASFQQPGPLTNLPELRRPDQARRDATRVSILATANPTDQLTVMAGYTWNKDDYKESAYGLQQASYGTFTGELDYTPSQRLTLFGFYTWESNKNVQRGRQSGASPSTNPADDWLSNVEDKGHSIGGGLNSVLKPERWFLDVLGSWQKVDGSNDLLTFAGGAPFTARLAAFGGAAQDLPLYDDTETLSVQASVRWQFSKAWAASLGGLFEDYKVEDSSTGGLLNYVPGSFFLAYNDGDYTAKVAWVSLSYRW